MSDNQTLDAKTLLEAFEIKDKVRALSNPLVISHELVKRTENQINQKMNMLEKLQEVARHIL